MESNYKSKTFIVYAPYIPMVKTELIGEKRMFLTVKEWIEYKLFKSKMSKYSVKNINPYFYCNVLVGFEFIK